MKLPWRGWQSVDKAKEIIRIGLARRYTIIAHPFLFTNHERVMAVQWNAPLVRQIQKEHPELIVGTYFSDDPDNWHLIPEDIKRKQNELSADYT